MSFTVIIADDERIAREGISRFLSDVPDFEVVAVASNGTDAVELTKLLEPDILLLDTQMPPQNMGGLLAFRELRQLELKTRILVLTRDQLTILTIEDEGGICMPKRADQLLVRKMRQLIDAPPGAVTQTPQTDMSEIVRNRIRKAGLTETDQSILALILFETKEIAKRIGRDDRYVRDRLSTFIYARLKTEGLIDPELPVPVWRQAEAIAKLAGILVVPPGSILEKAYLV